MVQWNQGALDWDEHQKIIGRKQQYVYGFDFDVRKGVWKWI
jgi:hypothetical protein